MPKGDGFGPPKETQSRDGRQMGNRPGAGPGGNCTCPNCGEKLPHERGIPCSSISCPKCGTRMIRE